MSLRERGPTRTAAPLRAAAPLVALAVVGSLDLLQRAREWPVPVLGLLDEPAHLLTAWLVLAALGLGGLSGSLPRVAMWALVGSVAIDVDHIPLYLWSWPVAHQGARPVTHSLATIAALLLIAGLLGIARGTNRGARTAALGLGAGVALHLLRDLASLGPGVPLFWPADADDVRVRYGWYLALLVLAAAVALVRALRTPRVSARDGR